MKLIPRNTQTRVKHEIFSKYLEKWGSIIIGGLSRFTYSKEWHFVYVDCFSYTGKYLGEKEDVIQRRNVQTVYGSPVIGIRVLDELSAFARDNMKVRIRVNTILIERDKKTFEALKNTLEDVGYSHRVKETGIFNSLKNGEIAMLNTDSTQIVDELLAYTTQPNTYAFYLIDPFGPSGIPYDFVKKIVSSDKHDVMINFIYEDLPRKGGMALKDDLKPELKAQVDNWTNAFGGDEWIRIANRTVLAEDIGANEILRDDPDEYGKDVVFSKEDLIDIKEQKFVDAYRNVLYSMDASPSLAVKLINLRFGDKERTMFYLFLTTHDPTGALALNEILDSAKYLEYELRYRLQFVKRVAPPPRQPMLLPIQEEELKAPEPIKGIRPSIDQIEKAIMNRFSGKQATKKDVYRELANTLYFRAEVDKALRSLRKQGLAQFSEFKHQSLIRFFVK